MTITRINTRPYPSLRWGLNAAPEFASVFNDVGQLFHNAGFAGLERGSAVANPIDLYETTENIVLQMAVPGMLPDQLDISVEGRRLAIRGALSEVSESESEDRRYLVKGITRGEFSRVVRIPSRVNPEAISATIDQGLLTVTMPKAPEAVARKISVGGSSGVGQEPVVVETTA